MEEPYVGDQQRRGLGSFLEHCFLCRKRLNPADDIFTYSWIRMFGGIKTNGEDANSKKKNVN
ncbi:hypothetical protein EJ110_NYTH57736 [Nymphaea thermarum]|nr:hypothetical protein EJ110_NYTH57736 [Nymphaea thermarum]